MNYDTTELMERLGSAATKEDAEEAMARAEDWYNRTPKAAILAWYETYRLGNQHAADINGDDGDLVEDWNYIVIFHRASALES